MMVKFVSGEPARVVCASPAHALVRTNPRVNEHLNAVFMAFTSAEYVVTVRLRQVGRYLNAAEGIRGLYVGHRPAS